MTEPPRVLVTGGSGFVGHHLIRRLVAEGFRVRNLDVCSSPEPLPRTEFCRGDVCDTELMRAALRDVSVVIHCASRVPLTKTPRELWRVNVEGTRSVLDACVKMQVPYLVHISSSAVLGVPRKCPAGPDTPCRPIEPYGRSKLAGEELVRKAETNGLRCAIVRPRTIVGSERGGIFQLLFAWLRQGRRIYIIGAGRNRFQLLHIDDLIDAIMLLVTKRHVGTVCVGAERFGTLAEDLGKLIRHAGSKSVLSPLPVLPAMAALTALDRAGLSPLAPWHYRTYHKPFFFEDRALRALGFSPKHSNSEMLCAAYDWFMAHPTASGESPHRSAMQEGALRWLRFLS